MEWQIEHWFVNLGMGIDDDGLPIATELLMFIVTPLNSVWKIPIAYFLIDGLSPMSRPTWSEML